ncbi:MAG: GTPase domain-containing protein [Planctomycetes bacterium]|nr:GTPase domain-containing protein [Planctomycetota bacterium]
MDEAVSLVLFGGPSAGKSSLLGALIQAGQEQEHLLKGKLNDRSQKLAGLQQELYHDKSAPTVDEVVSYPIAIEPEVAAAKSLPAEAVLIDCAGRSAQQLLSEKTAKQVPALARAVHNADTLIMVVDAAAELPELQRSFGQLAGYIRQLEEKRGKSSAVSGLPVYLVLSKCDLLAKKGDTTSTWIQRIEERKRQIDQAFRKFLDQQPGRDRLAFGKLDIHLWATAARRPVLADRPGVDSQPYGVAELFRQCLEAARDFRTRKEGASKWLQVVVAGVGSLVALMALLAFAVYITRPSAEVIALENALHGLLPAEGAKPADRLKEPLDDRLKQLRKIAANPDFPRLPTATQERVRHYVEEIEAYQKYNREFLIRVQDPKLATTDEELDQIEKAIRDLPLPAKYAESWKGTRIGNRVQFWLKDVKSLRDEGARTETWINEQIKAGKGLEKEGFRLLMLGESAPAKEREAWHADYKAFIEQPFPHRPRERPASAATITYDTVYHLQRVDRARQSWDEFKKSLDFIRERLM